MTAWWNFNQPKPGDKNREPCWASSSSDAVDWLWSFNGKALMLPANFKPDDKLLMKHATKCLDAIETLG